MARGDTGKAVGLQYVLCTGQGDWVMAQLFNDHQPEFRDKAPKGVAGCMELIADQFRKELK
jgi:hypothetical protein